MHALKIFAGTLLAGCLAFYNQAESISSLRAYFLSSLDGSKAEGFLPPELRQFVRAWERGAMSPKDAKKELWRFVHDENFRKARPDLGIVFVKTHKTGSSTITSVLHSLVTSHNLTSPITGPDESGGYFYQLTENKIEDLLTLDTTDPHQWGAPYDVWCNHVTYNDVLVDRAVPSSGGKVVSIVRDPATRIQSAASFFGCGPHFKQSKGGSNRWASYVLSLEDELQYNNAVIEQCRVDGSSYEIVGMEPRDPNFERELQKVIVKVKRGDWLLLVTERMEESMLSLLHFYGLHPLDIVFLSKKVQPLDEVEEEEKQNVTKAKQLLREWNKHDMQLHTLADEVLTENMGAIFPDPMVRERAREEISLLNDLVLHVCADDLLDFTPELNYWCKMKALDNGEWNRAQMEILKENL